jgi:hypothetical protein
MPSKRCPSDRYEEGDFHVAKLCRHFAENLRQLRGIIAAAQPFQRPTRALFKVGHAYVLVCHKILLSPPAGVSGRTVEKIAQVVKAVEETPGKTRPPQ